MPGLRVGIGLHEHRQRISVPGVGDPGLGAVHHVLVTLAASDHRDALKVAARLRLRERDAGTAFAGREIGQPPILGGREELETLQKAD